MDQDLRDVVAAEPELRSLFGELRAVGDRPAPAVCLELAELLAGTPSLGARRRRKLIRSGTIGMVTAGIMVGGLGAAAADELPAPAQRIVSRVVNTITPFDIPNPDEPGPVEHQDDTTIVDNGDQPRQDVDQPGTGDQRGIDGDHPDRPGEVNQTDEHGSSQGDQPDEQASDQQGSPTGDQGDGEQGGTTGDRQHTSDRSGQTGAGGNGVSGGSQPNGTNQNREPHGLLGLGIFRHRL